jgi:hypothetical protein
VLPATPRIDIAQFSVPSRARAGQAGSLVVTVRNSGIVTTDVMVRVDQIAPHAELVGTRTITGLAPGARSKVTISYPFTSQDAPLATFRATATTPAGTSTSADASTRVTP